MRQEDAWLRLCKVARCAVLIRFIKKLETILVMSDLWFCEGSVVSR